MVMVTEQSIAIEAPKRITTTVALPASKSISNRALIINALSPNPCALQNLSTSDDTATLQNALAHTNTANTNIGAAGTAMRFLTAFFATKQGHTIELDGSERMRMRPIKPLVDALRFLGADISYCGREGFPPLHISGKRLTPRHLCIDGSLSSQFTSAILMIAPIIGDMCISITGKALSLPYIDMTLAIMRQFGITTQRSGLDITIDKGDYCHNGDFGVESDWSAASYWFAISALCPQSAISLTGLNKTSVQGDSEILSHLAQIGLQAAWQADGSLRLNHNGDTADFFKADFSGTPDIAQTFIVMLCLLGIKFRLHGLSNLKIKETDRLNAMVTEMAKIGFSLSADSGSIAWLGDKCQASQVAPVFDTYKDHRMAMSMALAATRLGKVIINEPSVVTKSYPDFWNDLAQAGFKITPAT